MTNNKPKAHSSTLEYGIRRHRWNWWDTEKPHQTYDVVGTSYRPNSHTSNRWNITRLRLDDNHCSNKQVMRVDCRRTSFLCRRNDTKRLRQTPQLTVISSSITPPTVDNINGIPVFSETPPLYKLPGEQPVVFQTPPLNQIVREQTMAFQTSPLWQTCLSTPQSHSINHSCLTTQSYITHPSC